MSFLRRNLDAIFYTSPELIKRILKPVQDDYIEKTNDGTFLKIGLSKIPITCSEEDCNKFKQKMEETEEVVFGSKFYHCTHQIRYCKSHFVLTSAS